MQTNLALMGKINRCYIKNTVKLKTVSKRKIILELLKHLQTEKNKKDVF